MALKYKVKAGRLTNLTDARFFNAQGTDWLGFSMDVLDEHAVSLKDIREIKNWLFEPRLVIECGDHQDRTEMIYLANELHAEAIQVEMDHPVLAEEHFLYPLFVVVPFGDLQHVRLRRLLERQTAIEGLIIRFPKEGFDWNSFRKQASGTRRAFQKLQRKLDVLIEMEFQPEWFKEVLEVLQPSGVHFLCEPEEKPGWSNVDEYAALLELIEVGDEEE